jgi:orotate phosphoribosyltransferase
MPDRQIARALLDIGAVGFSPHAPVTFSSGILSPVYVDNRRLIYWPEQWHMVIEGFRYLLNDQEIEFDVIAGIATGGIPHSSALAYTLNAPSVFVRKQAKDYGRQNLIEGGDVTDARVLLVEDMITTGGSSLAGVGALREAGAIVQHCLSITTFGFIMSKQSFHIAGVDLHSLVEFPVIVDEALTAGLINESELAMIEAWHAEPFGWAGPQDDDDSDSEI